MSSQLAYLGVGQRQQCHKAALAAGQPCLTPIQCKFDVRVWVHINRNRITGSFIDIVPEARRGREMRNDKGV